MNLFWSKWHCIKILFTIINKCFISEEKKVKKSEGVRNNWMYSGEAKARNVITMNYLIASHMTERLSLYLSILAKAQTRLICRQVKKGNWSSLQISLF